MASFTVVKFNRVYLYYCTTTYTHTQIQTYPGTIAKYELDALRTSLHTHTRTHTHTLTHTQTHQLDATDDPVTVYLSLSLRVRACVHSQVLPHHMSWTAITRNTRVEDDPVIVYLCVCVCVCVCALRCRRTT